MNKITELLRSSETNNNLSHVIMLTSTAKKYYDVNADLREYHNFEHANNVAKAVHMLTANEPSSALIIAAIWHDAVYFPGAGSDANERCSSTALGIEARNIARGTELSKELKDAVNAAQDLIEYTSMQQHMHYSRISGDLAVLLDADLRSLATEKFEDFVVVQECIIRENNGCVPDDYNESAQFLSKFLRCRDFIYHTDKAREMWEHRARLNITRYCNEHGVLIVEDETR